MDAAVADEAEEVDAACVVVGVLERRGECRVLVEWRVLVVGVGRRFPAPTGDGVRDARRLLCDDATGPDSEMAHLAVSHLSLGETDPSAMGPKRRRRTRAVQAVEGRRRRTGDGVACLWVGIEPPAVEDDQTDVHTGPTRGCPETLSLRGAGTAWSWPARSGGRSKWPRREDLPVRAYRLAYDGRPYHGFQRQPDVQTVEDALLDALVGLDVLDEGTGRTRPVPPGYAAAGRTDAGVSATAQTVAFEAPEWLTPAALNAKLPADVRAWAAADAPEGFHATHHADEREYTYFLHAPDGPHERAERALAALSGTHDFHNLTPDDEGTVRDLSTAVERDGPFLVVRLRAGGFPRQLVRRAVAVVAEVVRGESLDRIERLLGDDPVDGPAGVGPTPAYPLVLTDVSYPELSFRVDEQAAASARAVFERQQAEHATVARVAGRLSEIG